MEIEITEVRMKDPIHRLRAWLVFGVASLLRVPIKLRDEFHGAPPVGEVSFSSEL